jgi:hypothetical protein
MNEVVSSLEKRNKKDSYTWGSLFTLSILLSSLTRYKYYQKLFYLNDKQMKGIIYSLFKKILTLKSG